MESRLHLLCLICIQSWIYVLASGTACPFNDTSGTIDLSNRGLTSINALTFTSVYDCSQVFGNVSSLNLSHNSISSVSNDSFNNFYELISLDLSHNAITTIDNSTFRSLVALQNLYLGYNGLTKLDAGLIDLFNLEVVGFEYNQISYVEPGIVNDIHENLVYFNLNFNNLTSLDPWPYLIKYRDGYKDVVFDIQYNQINELTNNFNWTYDLVYQYEVEVNIQYNNLETLGVDILDMYHINISNPSLIVTSFLTLYLNVTNNPYFCDCRLYDYAFSLRDSILRWTRIDEFRYICEGPSAVSGIDWLHDLPFDQLVCNVTSGCPSSCLCLDRPHNDTFYVDCSNSNLSEIPDLSNMSLNGRSKLEINLDNNVITLLASVSHIDKIYNISLQHNKVTEISTEFLEGATSLANLDLRHNQISKLPKEIQHINFRSVHLSDNPLWCDCDTIWMAEWIKTERSQVDSWSLQCNSDTGFHSLIDISQEKLNCVNQETTIVIIIGAVIAFVVLTVLAFAKRCPYSSKVILHMLCRLHPWDKYVVDKDDNKDVDIYLVFDEKDCDVVGYVDSKLSKQLSKYKPRYNIVNPHRFYFAGNETEAIDNKIRKVKRVVVVLSEKIFQNHTRMDEIRNADVNIFEAIAEQRALQDEENQQGEDNNTLNAARIIYIKYNKSKKLEETLKAEPWRSGFTNAKYRAFLDAADRLFWQKLRYELPPVGCGSEADGLLNVMSTRRKINTNNGNNDNAFFTINLRQNHPPLASNKASPDHRDTNGQHVTKDTSQNRHANVNTARWPGGACLLSNHDELAEIKVKPDKNSRGVLNIMNTPFSENRSVKGRLSENKSRIQNYGRHLTSKDFSSKLQH